MTAQFGQNTLKILILVKITPTKLIISYIVIYQNVRATHPEVWEPLHIPSDLILCPLEFFHAVILDIEPWFWTVSYVNALNKSSCGMTLALASAFE